MEAKTKSTIKLITFLAMFGMAAGISVYLSNLPMTELPSINLNKIPLNFGEWTGKEVELEGGELAIAESSSMIKRRYRIGDEESYDEVWLIAVSAAKDRHSAHHPKYCYIGTGWAVKKSRPGLGRDHLATEVVLHKVIDKEEYTNLERYFFTDGVYVEPSFFSQLYTAFRLRLIARQLPNWSLFRLIIINTDDSEYDRRLIQKFGDDLMAQIKGNKDLFHTPKQSGQADSIH